MFVAFYVRSVEVVFARVADPYARCFMAPLDTTVTGYREQT
jgi:hypothetical protein